MLTIFLFTVGGLIIGIIIGPFVWIGIDVFRNPPGLRNDLPLPDREREEE